LTKEPKILKINYKTATSLDLMRGKNLFKEETIFIPAVGILHFEVTFDYFFGETAKSGSGRISFILYIYTEGITTVQQFFYPAKDGGGHRLQNIMARLISRNQAAKLLRFLRKHVGYGEIVEI
jgi:hypothetical protein